MAIQAKKRKTGVPNPVELYVSLRNYIESRSTPAADDDVAELLNTRRRAEEYGRDYGISVPTPSIIETRHLEAATNPARR